MYAESDRHGFRCTQSWLVMKEPDHSVAREVAISLLIATGHEIKSSSVLHGAFLVQQNASSAIHVP